jgi:hypothetical protein
MTSEHKKERDAEKCGKGQKTEKEGTMTTEHRNEKYAEKCCFAYIKYSRTTNNETGDRN